MRRYTTEYMSIVCLTILTPSVISLVFWSICRFHTVFLCCTSLYFDDWLLSLQQLVVKFLARTGLRGKCNNLIVNFCSLKTELHIYLKFLIWIIKLNSSIYSIKTVAVWLPSNPASDEILICLSKLTISPLPLSAASCPFQCNTTLLVCNTVSGLNPHCPFSLTFI